MICNICKKYSSDASQVGIRQFYIHGKLRSFVVCLKPEHPNALEILTQKVDTEEKAMIERQKKIEEDAKKVLAEEEKRKREYEEQIAREKEEATYKRSMHNFEQLTNLNPRAMAEIFKRLKEAYESQNKE
ncbi:MAG: hypothetical protein M1327_06615 [Candidatus Thermoplasmatota archaeon]|nr:hypothetical protein [Candidatus Thermoplasmatota archaeon]